MLRWLSLIPDFLCLHPCIISSFCLWVHLGLASNQQNTEVMESYVVIMFVCVCVYTTYIFIYIQRHIYMLIYIWTLSQYNFPSPLPAILSIDWKQSQEKNMYIYYIIYIYIYIHKLFFLHCLKKQAVMLWEDLWKRPCRKELWVTSESWTQPLEDEHAFWPTVSKNPTISDIRSKEIYHANKLGDQGSISIPSLASKCEHNPPDTFRAATWEPEQRTQQNCIKLLTHRHCEKTNVCRFILLSVCG